MKQTSALPMAVGSFVDQVLVPLPAGCSAGLENVKAVGPAIGCIDAKGTEPAELFDIWRIHIALRRDRTGADRDQLLHGRIHPVRETVGQSHMLIDEGLDGNGVGDHHAARSPLEESSPESPSVLGAQVGRLGSEQGLTKQEGMVNAQQRLEIPSDGESGPWTMDTTNAAAQINEMRIVQDMVDAAVAPSRKAISGKVQQVDGGQNVLQEIASLSPRLGQMNLLIQVPQKQDRQMGPDRVLQVTLKIRARKLKILQGPTRVWQVGNDHRHGNLQE